MPTLRSIHIYPLKSCAPLSMPDALVYPRGLANDRRWLAIDERSNFITARDMPRLTLVRATPHVLGLHLDAPDTESLLVAFPNNDGRRIPVTIWDDRVAPLVADNAANHWISAYLGRACRIVYMDDACARPTDPDWAPDGEVSFADGYPLLLLSQAAVDHLNTRLANPVAALRFRPNLIIDGTEPHAEDDWKRIRVGDVEFDLVKPCVRCILTTVNFETGELDPGGEPLRTLITYRRSAKGVTFGQNLVPRGTGRIRVGDAVTVLA